jgi:NDP-sugar pyrophosphorylase family protein
VAVIMAGGRGQRLRPLTDKVPKPLLRVGGRSIVERIILSLAEAGIRDVYLAVSYKAQAFEERLGDGAALGVRITYLRERERLGTAGALSMVPPDLGRSLLVMNADIMTRLAFADLVSFHGEHGDPATIAAIRYTSRVPYAVLRTEGTALTGIEEKPEQGVLCNAGIYMLRPEVLPLVPADTTIDMPDLLEKVMAEGRPVRVFEIRDKWFDIGSPEDFEHVLLEFATGEEE